MTEKPSEPREPRPTASFDSSPSDTGRSYQAARDQNIYEHHYHGPTPHPATASSRRAKPAKRFWLTSLAAILLVGAASGSTWLWLKPDPPTVTASEDRAPHSAKPSTTSPASPTERTHRTTPEKSHTSKFSVTPETPVRVPEEPPNPADPKNCRAWFTSQEMPNVQARPCWRRDGSRVYMVGEWRTTRGSGVVDIYLWLKDTSGNAVYPPIQALSYSGVGAYVPDPSRRQWTQAEVGIDLVQGTKYTVCLGLLPSGSPKPVISNTAVKGIQKDFTY